ncbi:hypothetical protein AB0442_39535 [Kitasatospora sp. NPDC085895]|uniref:hypothetical protein n=1 Tax=Kitasatospora sp. NPDC085895 TaxID=3155057 RepID=UPI00344BE7B2
MHLDRAPALWMLGSRDFAAVYNTAYERVYPGALAQLGVANVALEDAAALGTVAHGPHRGREPRRY